MFSLGLLPETDAPLPFAAAQQAIAPATKEAFASLAVFAIELNEGLAFGSIRRSADLGESTNRLAVFGFDATQEVYCPLAVVLHALPPQPSIAKWGCYIDQQGIRRNSGKRTTGRNRGGLPKAIVRSPVRRCLHAELLCQFFSGHSLHKRRKQELAAMQNGGQLSQSTMYERGRTGAMQTKERRIKRLQVELMSQKAYSEANFSAYSSSRSANKPACPSRRASTCRRLLRCLAMAAKGRLRASRSRASLFSPNPK